MEKNIMSAIDVDPTRQYACPICRVQKTSSTPDIGWLSCPMADGQAICLGCCFDYQSITRSSGYDSHPFLPDFMALVSKYNKNDKEMRLICLHHQVHLYLVELEDTRDAIKKRAFSNQIKNIEMIVQDLERHKP